jgi:flagellar basal-body rod modification protein FlgD
MITAASAMPATVTALPMGSQVPTSASGVSASGQTLNQNDFLQLLTAQLENQDPLDPLTSADFAAELAEFSTATGVQNLETSLAGQAAVGLVGHNVAVSGNALVLGQNGATATGSFNLSAAAANVAVTITNAAGQTVASLSLGPMAAGTQTFSWNGAGTNGSTLPAGTYSFRVSAAGANGAAVSATPYAVVPVTGVALGGQSGPLLDLGGGLAPVPVSAVQQVF